MPKINKKFLKDYFATRGPRPSLLKFSVASSLIVFGITASVFLVGGLLVPESVLLKLSGQPENSASALVGNSEAGTNDTLDKSTGIDVGSNSTAPTTGSLSRISRYTLYALRPLSCRRNSSLTEPRSPQRFSPVTPMAVEGDSFSTAVCSSALITTGGSATVARAGSAARAVSSRRNQSLILIAPPSLYSMC